MAPFVAFALLSMLSTGLCDVFNYQPEAVHLAYGGNIINLLRDMR